MANSVHSIQAAYSQAQTEQAVQPPKSLQAQAAAQNKGSQDTVTISQQARHALVSNTKHAGGSDTNHNGENHES